MSRRAWWGTALAAVGLALVGGFLVSQWAGQTDSGTMDDRLARELRQAAEQREALDALRESGKGKKKIGKAEGGETKELPPAAE